MSSALCDSSVATQKYGESAEALANAQNEVTARGLQAQANRKQDVAARENTVTGQLVNTADIGAAMENASSAIRTNTSPTPTPMLGQIFTDLSAGLRTHAARGKAGEDK